MVRKFTRRRFTRRKRFTRKRVLATKSYVKKQIRKDIETKYADTQWNIGIPGAGTITDLTNIAQGVSDLERVGDKISLRGLRLKMGVFSSNNADPAICRITVFQWHPDTAFSLPTVGKLFTYTAAPDIVYSPFVHDQANQFQILFDKVVITQTNTQIEHVKIMRKVNMKYAKKAVHYSGGGVTGSEKLYISIQTNSPTTNPGVFGFTRLYYDDA